MRLAPNFKSINIRLLVPTIGLLTLLLGGLGGTLVYQNRKFAESMLEARATSLVNLLEKVGSGYVSYYNLRELDTLADQAMKDPEIRFVAFYDDKGKLMTEKAQPPAEPAPDPMLLRVQRDFHDADGRPIGSMVLVHSRQGVADNSRKNVAYVVTGAALTLVLFILGMLLLTRDVVRPIQELTRAAQEVVAKGDLRANISVATQDEVGQLAASFQGMVDKLRGALGNLQSSATTLDASVSELTSSTQEQSQTLTKQAAALQETQVTAQEIKQTSLIAAQKAESVLQVMEQADRISQGGEAAVEQTIQGLKEIRDQVQEISAKINQLGSRAQQIADITQAVKDLADQSNMLALNAAIEAARGGEHGRGFAVVAREIRSLADQSISATGRVRDILNDITNAIREAVTITQVGVQRVEQGLVQVRSSGDSVRQLSAIVKENSAAARQIASAVAQQNTGIVQIFTAVTDLSKMMEDTMKRLEVTNAAVGNISSVSKRSNQIVEDYTV